MKTPEGWKVAGRVARGCIFLGKNGDKTWEEAVAEQAPKVCGLAQVAHA